MSMCSMSKDLITMLFLSAGHNAFGLIFSYFMYSKKNTDGIKLLNEKKNRPMV